MDNPYLKPVVDKVFRQYLITALWSSTDDHDNPLDDNYSIDDIHSDSIERLRVDVENFIETNILFMQTWGDDYESQTGHDLWLTQNGHGVGFWESEWECSVTNAGYHLNEAAKQLGERFLYVGDDGMVHCD